MNMPSKGPGGRAANPLRTSIPLALLIVVMSLFAVEAAPSGAAQPGRAAPPANDSKSAVSAYGQLPLSFVANAGQTDPRAAFVAAGRGYTLFVGPAERVFVARPPARDARGPARLRAGRAEEPAGLLRPDEAERAVVHMRLLGADASTGMAGEEQTATINYLVGNDRSRWRSGVPAYA